jgi:fructose-bisphosphate aldolase class II
MLVRTRGSRFAHPVIKVTSPIVAKAVPKGLEASGNGETIRVFSGGEAFASGPAVKDIPLGAISTVERLQPMAEHCNVYVALHADHCQPKNPDKFLLPPVHESERRCQAGLSSLFNNPISDGSGIRS